MGGRSACSRLNVGAEAAAQLLLLASPRRGAPTLAGPSLAHRPLGTTLPGKTRARARAPGPPPWRPCCPGRSSSRVRRRSLATTPPLQGLGRLGGKALGRSRSGPGPNPGGAAGARRERVQSSQAGVRAPPGGERCARWVGGRRRGASLGNSKGGIAGDLRGRWPGADWCCCCGECQSSCRRGLRGRASEGSILSLAPRLMCRWVSSSSLGLDLGGGRGRQEDV